MMYALRNPNSSLLYLLSLCYCWNNVLASFLLLYCLRCPDYVDIASCCCLTEMFMMKPLMICLSIVPLSFLFLICLWRSLHLRLGVWIFYMLVSQKWWGLILFIRFVCLAWRLSSKMWDIGMVQVLIKLGLTQFLVMWGFGTVVVWVLVFEAFWVVFDAGLYASGYGLQCVVGLDKVWSELYISFFYYLLNCVELSLYMQSCVWWQ